MNLNAIDHRIGDIGNWVKAYSGGESVDGEDVLLAVSSSLAELLKSYRYLKSKHIFRYCDDVADNYICLSRDHGTLRLRFGLTHHEVERTIHSLFGSRLVQLKNSPATISMFTANMGPHSRGWSLPYRVEWPVTGRDGLTLAIPEINSFVQEIVLPYLEHHQTPEAIRDTYLHTPGHSDFFFQSEQMVFAVDYLTGRSDQLKSDRDLLIQRYGEAEDSRARINAAFAKVVKAQYSV
jgi:hypothetical protein